MKFKLSIVAFFAVSSLQAITIGQAVQKGLKYDPDIAAETKKYNSKKISVDLAKAGYLPKVDVYSGIGHENTKRDNLHSQQSNGSMTRKEASAHFRQPLFEGYATTYDVSSAYAEKEATGYSLDAFAQNKSLSIVKAYLNVLKMQDIVKLAKDNLNTHYKILKSIKERYAQGVTDKADLNQIQGRVNSAQTNLFASQNNLMDAEAVYNSVVGIMPRHLKPVYDAKIKIPKTLNRAIAKAKKEHPTGMEAKKNIDLTKNLREKSKSGYYPHLYADMSANHEYDAGGIEGPQDTFQAMVRVEWNVFDGFKDDKRHELAQVEVLRAGDQYNNTKRQLELETRLSWNAYTVLKNQLKPLNEHVKYARETRKLYQEQYEVNKRSLIDVLNEQIEYFNAQKEYVTAKYDKIAAKYRILNSIGMLNKTLRVKIAK
jgi:adhesin transport system outer membrane protein